MHQVEVVREKRKHGGEYVVYKRLGDMGHIDYAAFTEYEDGQITPMHFPTSADMLIKLLIKSKVEMEKGR